MRITPSPRILKMLGQIEFAEWQCLAELIDNSIDALRQAESSGTSKLPDDDYCIEVYLPDAPVTRTSTVEVRDHAPGMTPERLQQAVRAGWSGNDQFDQLGLFGMGFNVATARLGKVTTVITTQKSDQSWIGVEIDLDNLGEDFEAKDIARTKDDPVVHGTCVTISELEPERADLLVRRQSAIRSKLGHIYSWILSNTKVKIRVNGRLVTPKKPCVWGDNRSVTRGSGKSSEVIPAVIRIEEHLGSADACADCGNWQAIGDGQCRVCGSKNISSRDRKIHGWLGIQRYLHSNSYGIDFLRNGRKIVTSDKELFTWLDSNNPSAVPEPEYPVEVPADQGRIVGEIHLDHVPVHYMKDRFDTADRAWRSAIEFLRGPGPLKPQRAKQLGYPVNNSPLGRLFRGFRRNDPGFAYLVPGDGTRAINQQAQEWGLKFDRGDSDFQGDTKWWEAVVYHEKQVALKNAPPEASSDDANVKAVLEALEGADGKDKDDSSSDGHSNESKEVKPLTTHDKIQLLLKDAISHPILTREVYSRSLGESLNVRAYTIANSPLIDGNNNSHTSIWLSPAEGGAVNLFIDPNHESFTVHGIDVLDLAIAQLSHFMLVRSQSTAHSISQIIFELRRENFSDEKTDFVTVQASARDLLNQAKSNLVPLAAEDSNRAWGLLSSNEIAHMESSGALSGKSSSVIDSSDSDFIDNAPFLYLLKLFDDWPELFLDGNIFKSRYKTLSDENAKQVSKSRIASLLIDVIAISSEERSPSSLNQLKRARLAVEMLRSEMRPS